VESIELRSANCRDEARADIHSKGFWGQRQSAFFDVRVFTLMHGVTGSPASLCCIGVRHSKRRGNMEIALGRWSRPPFLVFATTGGMENSFLKTLG